MNKSESDPNFEKTAGFLGGLVRQARLGWRLLKDRRVPGWVKVIPVAGLIYLLSPIDLLPDVLLPGLGEIDDIALLLIALKLFIDFSPPALVNEHLEALSGKQRRPHAGDEPPSGETIEVPYRVLGPGED